MAISKALAGGWRSLVTQDLSPNPARLLKWGDDVGVKYTGWLVSGSALGSQFDSNVSYSLLLPPGLVTGDKTTEPFLLLPN